MFKKLGWLVLLFFSVVVSADEGDAEEENLLTLFGDEGFISLATGLKQPVSKAPAVASVIEYEDMKRMGAIDIDDVLETVPGLHVSKDSTAYKSIYSFRGIYSNVNPQVLLLINGIPVTNLYQGDRSLIWGGMPVEAVSRIEVIRGPGSAVYGADAFSGVINVITKTGREINGFSVTAQVGNFDTQRASISYGNSWDELSLGVVIEAGRTDGDDSIIDFDAQSLLDEATGTSASLAPGTVNLYNKKLDVRVDLEYREWRFRTGLQQREIQNGVGVAQALDPTNRYASDRWNFDLTYDNKAFANNLEVFLQASYYHTTQEIEEDLVLYPPGSTGPFITPDGPMFPEGYPNGVIGNPEVFEAHTRFNSSIVYTGIDSHNLRAGVGYYHGDVYKTKEEKNFLMQIGNFCAPVNLPELIDVSDTQCVFLPEDDRENYYFYVQDIWSFLNDWELTIGVRYDDYTDFGSTVNPRLALVWSTSHNLTTKLLYGEAFRAPSFSETRVSSNPVLLGNPNLDPEELKSYELAFDYQPQLNLGLNLNFFYYQWDDIIQYVPGAGGSATAQNAGEQTGYGMEFEASWDISSTLALTGNFAWQQSTDEEIDEDAANSPEKQVYLKVDWQPAENWRVNLQAKWIMDRNRVIGDSRAAIDDYVWVDLTLRRKEIFKGFEAALLVKNLFDEDAREPSSIGATSPSIPNDLPLSGRTVLGEIRFHF